VRWEPVTYMAERRRVEMRRVPVEIDPADVVPVVSQ